MRAPSSYSCTPSFYAPPNVASRLPTPAQRADLIRDLDFETEGLASAVAESCLL